MQGQLTTQEEQFIRDVAEALGVPEDEIAEAVAVMVVDGGATDEEVADHFKNMVWKDFQNAPSYVEQNARDFVVEVNWNGPLDNG
jgi:hypothetical protein